MRSINEIIIHCTGNTATSKITVADIRRYHIKERHFADIGYHFVIYANGKIEEGRPVSKSGAHCKGHNAHSIGISYIGGLLRNGKPADTRTQAQKTSLVELIRKLKSRFPSITKVSGHRDYANKACPCFNAHAELQHLVM